MSRQIELADQRRVRRVDEQELEIGLFIWEDGRGKEVDKEGALREEALAFGQLGFAFQADLSALPTAVLRGVRR
ncbi:hypothetical protein [Asticcacaulis sp. MM231]|uniref:hypothetical protein n=1 Tax=Asticcacaulis sp. MM231 TaxID=3157666 RepID=UPI0032D59C17